MKINKIYADVLAEDMDNEYKSVLNPDNPVKWAKTLIGYANGKGGILFVGVSNEGEAFGISLDEIDKTKLLIAKVNDRYIFPHIKIGYMMRSVDEDAERFVLAVHVTPSDSIIRWREGDFNETVYIKGDGYSTPATPEEIISLSKKKYGVDNETSDIYYSEQVWTEYIELCKEYRKDKSAPSLKELQNEEAVSKEGLAKSGLIMFKDGYSGDDSLICCRLWKGKNKTGTVLDSGRFKGSLANVFRYTMNFIERNTKTGWQKTINGGREEIRSYPKEAVREALVNAIAHRDYSIAGTQIDVDIYNDRIEIVSPGSWLLPMSYEEYPVGSIPSIRRNSIIAACLDVANLMERGGTGFQTMMRSYADCEESLQPVVTIYPGFLNLRLFDKLYNKDFITPDFEQLSDKEKIIALLSQDGPKPVKELQKFVNHKNRSSFLREVINPLIEAELIYRDGNPKSPTSLIKIKK
ncbi:Predicted transcriptional regulator, contains HTH domain [[Clostridium] aminophilum]|uniref:Predicted transcriptional regulator, contains HTH domain n=1 Tax=[Clostridium] aminophilum TaxID=1526 RepID=A0A1I0GEU3_9FIRM|nr:ATP-binding protein [[Clostridium] aminophilum]SET69372.1 Predicted transcriptional regulator, contains HTH domain [[Clostridium] aminophilum]